MAAGALAESAPPQGAQGSVYYAYDYGIYADGIDHGAALNALITAVSVANGGHIILPGTGFVRTSIPIVMQASVWLQGGGMSTGIQLTNTAACDVLNYQCYCPTAVAWTASTVYSANALVTAPGPGGASWYYVANQSIGGTVTAAPIGDFYNWTAFSPVPVAGVAPSATAQASACKLSDLHLLGNNTLAPNGDWHHAHNFAASAIDPNNLVDTVWARRATGDSFHTTGGGAGLNSNSMRYINCYGASSAGSAINLGYDSEVTGCHFGYHGLGGMLFQRNSVRVTSTKSYNNGYTPAFMAENTTGTGTATGVTTNVTVATLSLTSDMIGQGIFDGAGSVPGQGSIPAGTYIADITSTSALVLSQATTGSIAGGTMLHIGGYYFQPPSGSGDIKGPMGCVGTADGIVYTLKVASVSGLGAGAAPAVGSPAGAGTTNFQPIRTAYEWGWDYTAQSATMRELVISACTSQSAPRGALNLQTTGTADSNIQVSSSRWQQNPRVITNLITVPQNVTNLSNSACCTISSSSGNLVELLVGNTTGTAPGSLINWVSGTNNNVVINGDAAWTTTMPASQAVPIGGNLLTINGVGWGAGAIDPRTYRLGPTSNAGANPCLAETIPNGRSIGLAFAGSVLAGGVLRAQLVYIPPGVSITRLSFATGTTAAVGPTHWWMGLHSSTGTLLANTADQLTAAIGATLVFDVATTATYVTTDPTGFYYVSLVFSGTTPPTVLASPSPSGPLLGLTPITSGVFATGVTTVASFQSGGGTNWTPPTNSGGFDVYQWAG